MSILAKSRIAELLEPYLVVPAGIANEESAGQVASPRELSPANSSLQKIALHEIIPQLAAYLELLLRWNARTNLTAIRDPEEMVRRHFGESLFAAQHIGFPETLLDLGSGAGFPGLPIALARPGIAVTLAESQGKKSTFLREAVRTLSLKNVEVWAGRAEALQKTFHTVAMRAVDDMEAAMAVAGPLAEQQMALLTTGDPGLPAGFAIKQRMELPRSANGILLIAGR